MGHGDDEADAAGVHRPGPDTEPDYWGLLRVLSEHDVDFVVIGGFAVGMQGYVRATKDVDVVPASTPENLSRLWDAVSSIEARPADWDEFDPQELPPFSREGLIENGGNWILYTKLGRLDVMPYVEDDDGELPYEDLRAAADSESYPEVGHRVWFASVTHLIAMKQHAGRDEDLRDVTALRRAHGLQDD